MLNYSFPIVKPNNLPILHDYEKRAKNAGCKLYFDARKATGYEPSDNSKITNPMIDLIGTQNTYTYTNKIANGGFDDDITGWTTTAGVTLAVSDGIATMLADSQNDRIQFTTSRTNTYKYYIVCRFKSTSSAVAVQSMGSGITALYHSGSGEYETKSTVVTATSTTSSWTIGIIDTRSSSWDNIFIDYIMVVDLTSLGLSYLTATQCDALFSFTTTSNSFTLGDQAWLNNFAGTPSSGWDMTNIMKPSLVFNTATTCHATLANTSAIDLTSAPIAVFSTVWIPSASTSAFIFCKYISSYQYSLYFSSTNQITMYNSTGSNKSSDSNLVYRNNWINIGWFWDGTTISFYRNGSIYGATQSLSGSLSSVNAAAIGCRLSGTTNFALNGKIATLTIYTGNNISEILRSEIDISKAYLG